MNVTLRQLRAFVAGADNASFSEAARQVGLTQPGFSLLIRQLEEELAVRLFDRTTRRVALTSVGEELVTRVRRILQELDESFQDVRDLRSKHKGRVVIASLPSAAASIISTAINRVKTAYPGVRVTILEGLAGSISDAVLRREADFGFGADFSSNSELLFTPMAMDKLVGVFPLGDPVLTLKEITWMDLATRPFIRFSGASSIQFYVDRAINDAGVHLQRAGEVAHMTTAISLVSSGAGFTTLPELALGSLNLEKVAIRPVGSPIATRTLGTLTLKRRSASPASEIAQLAVASVCHDMQRETECSGSVAATSK